MSRHLDMTVLQPLRRHRRPLGWAMAALMSISLASALGQCLVMGSMATPGAAVSERSTMPGDMPCANCTLGGDPSTLDEAAPALLGSIKPGFVLALIVVSALLALSFPKSIPIPPRPLLPKRPRTLKFAVLRI